MTGIEPASWRVYHYEWITVHTAFGRDSASAIEHATAHYTEHYAGRVREADVQYLFDEETYGRAAVLLQLRLPNLRGEFKDRERAEQFSDLMFGAEPGHRVHVVGADTEQDRTLLAYGVKQLPVELHDRISVEPDAAEAVNPK